MEQGNLRKTTDAFKKTRPLTNPVSARSELSQPEKLWRLFDLDEKESRWFETPLLSEKYFAVVSWRLRLHFSQHKKKSKSTNTMSLTHENNLRFYQGCIIEGSSVLLSVSSSLVTTAG